MQFFHYDTIDSTNEQAKRLIADDAIRDAACIIARAQTAGRGTRGRTWLSPRDAGLYLTLVEARPPDAPLRTTTLYTVAAGIGCAETLRELTGLPIMIKPVNDLYCRNGKLGGILCESIIARGCMRVLIVGIGLNTRRAARSGGGGREVSATDLEELLGSPASVPSVERLTDVLVPGVHRRLQQADQNSIDELRRAWVKLRLGAHPFPVEVAGRRQSKVGWGDTLDP